MNPRIREAVGKVDGACPLCMGIEQLMNKPCLYRVHALARSLARVVVEEAVNIAENAEDCYDGEENNIGPNSVAIAEAIRSLLGEEAERGE